MSLDTATITGSLTARLTDGELRRVCDHLENFAAGDEDADRATLVAALTDTVTNIVGALPWGGCSATVTDDHGLLTVAFGNDAPAGPLEVCELLAHWLTGSIAVTSDDGAAHYEVGNGKVTRKTAAAQVGRGDEMWLAQFIYLDGGTFVHICRSKEDAYLALARQEDVEIPEGQTAEEVIDDLYGDSCTTSYNVAQVDSTNL